MSLQVSPRLLMVGFEPCTWQT